MSGVSADPAREAADLLARTDPPMVLLRPGDRVLVAFTDEPGATVTEHITSGLRRAFPGVDFTVLTGVSGMAVQSGG